MLSEAFNILINNKKNLHNKEKDKDKNKEILNDNNNTGNKIYSEEEGSCEELNNEFINSIHLLDSNTNTKANNIKNNNNNSNNIISNLSNKRKDSSLSFQKQGNNNKKVLCDRENETDIMIQFNILKQ